MALALGTRRQAGLLLGLQAVFYFRGIERTADMLY